MHYFIDRRANPKDKSLGNRQRFMKRARAQIKKALSDALDQQRVSDPGRQNRITIPTKGIDEPKFFPDPNSGRRHRVFPGNKEFTPGDRIARPPKQGGQGRGDPQADGVGEDEFSFTLNREEFLDLFFEDLELPDLIKTSLTDTPVYQLKQAGYRIQGPPSSLSLVRTMRQSLSRRIALKRPKQAEKDDIEARMVAMETLMAEAQPGVALEHLKSEYEILVHQLKVWHRRRQAIAYIDPFDTRYRAFEPIPRPNAKAVMFCLMDVSGSMGEREKDLAKRFFMLLHLFLQRRYEKTEIVFIRHTHIASEVDEESFFYGRETGGTVVSKVLEEMKRIVAERYPPSGWNIYAAQASDGDNIGGDSQICLQLLKEDILPQVQFFAYTEIVSEQEMEIIRSGDSASPLWQAYRQLPDQHSQFMLSKVARPSDIYPVFRSLFHKQNKVKHAS